MKVLIRDYLASLKEREELDAILPDLLSELGFTVFSRPKRGTTQHGVDVGAVGRDEDGEHKVFLFSLKQGDLTRQDWDGTTQSLRSSLNEIRDVYIRTRIPKRYHELKVVICLCFGGDMQEQVRGSVKGYTDENTTDRISFDEWNGDKLAGLLIQGVLREEILPKRLRSHFQKAIAMVDEPDIAYQHFSILVRRLTERELDGKGRVRVARQLYICLWILFVWARDIDNVDAAHRASELVLLHTWNLLRPYIGTRKGIIKALTTVLHHVIELHIAIATAMLERKILPHAGTRHTVSIAVQTSVSIDVNLRLFDILGRISLTGLWLHWLIDNHPDATLLAAKREQLGQLGARGFQLIQNNPCLFLPIEDQQAIEICLFLILAAHTQGSQHAVRSWLHEMVERLRFTLQTHGRYPCIYTDYRDLIEHPRARTDEYRKEATAGSILIPLIAAWLAALQDAEALKVLTELKSSLLSHCTLQLWMPDESSEDLLYVGRTDHGIALTDMPLTESGVELLETIKEACEKVGSFVKLSAHRTRYWPIILTACRHYRLPVPPQFWIQLLLPADESRGI
jgi:hypothetical protein